MNGVDLTEAPENNRQGIGQALKIWSARHPQAAAAIAFLVLILLVRGPSFAISVIDADESAFWIAAREVARGHLPYLTFFDIKPVGSTLLLALALKIFGNGLFAIRLAGALCVWATSQLLFRVATALGAERAVGIAAGVLYIGFATTMHGQATMTEILLAPFTVAGVLTLLVSLRQAGFRDSLGWMILSGLMFGMAVLIKLVPVAPAGAAVGIALLYRLLDRDLAFGRVIALGLAALFGVTAPLLLSALVYAGLGEWHAFYVSNLGFAGSYVHSSDSPSRLLSALLRISAGVWPLLMFAAIGVADDVRRVAAGKPPGFSQAVLMAWLLGELIASSSTLHFYPHYFLMTLPPLCLLAAMGVARSVRWALGAGRVSRGVVGLSLVLLLVPVAPVLALQGPTMLSGFDIWRAAAAEIRKDSAGRKPTLFVLTQGQLALYPMTGADLPTPKAQPAQLLSDDKTMTDTANRAEYQRILATRPEFIVLDQTEEPPAWVYEGLSPWVACCYTRVATVRDFLNFDMGVNRRHDVDIYQLRASALPSTRDAPARSPDRP